MPSFISPLTRDEERGRERASARATTSAVRSPVAARAKTFFYLTLPPPTTTALQFFSVILPLSLSPSLSLSLALHENQACRLKPKLGARHILFTFSPPSTTTGKHAAVAAAQCEQGVMRVQASPSVCRLGENDVLNCALVLLSKA